MMNRIVAITVFVGTIASAAEFDWKQMRAKEMEAAQRQDYPQAIALCRELWAQAADDVERGAAAQDLGIVLHYLGQEREAAVWLTRAMDAWQRVPASPERLPQTMQQLAVVYRRLGDYQGAERLFRAALAQPQISPTTRMKDVNAFADLLREQGRLSEAREMLHQAISVAGLPWYVRIESVMEIAGLEREAGSAQESVARWNEALELARANHSLAHEAVCLRGLGDAWLERHDVARALPLLRRSVYLFQMIDSPEPTQREVFQLANSRRSLAQAELMDGKALLAEELAQAAIDDVEKASLGTHPQAAALFDMLAEAQAARSRLTPALEALDKAEAIVNAHFGESSTIALTTAAKRGILEERAGQPEAAVRDLGASIAAMGRDRPDLARTRLRLLEYFAVALEATHRKEQAKAVREEIKTTSVE